MAKRDNVLRLTAADRKALALGLSPGMALASARARVPALKVMAANEPADFKLLERLADWCDGFTPLVALDAPYGAAHGLLLDITGASHLFGGEAAMQKRLCAALNAQGFTVCTAVAGTAMAARALAHYRPGSIVPAGGDSEAVAPLSVEALGLDPIASHALRRAGLKTIGQVASRKRAELTARFGAAMVFTLDTALGRAEVPLSPRLPLPEYRAEKRFAEPVTALDALQTTLTQLAGLLSKNLETRGQGARQVQAVFFRADGHIRRLGIETGMPVRDGDVLLRLLRERLDALNDPLDPGFGFDLVRLEVLRSEECRFEAAAFGRPDTQKEIRFLIDRLTTRFGAHRVLSFQPRDSHVPENAYTLVPAQYAEACHGGWEKPRHGAPARPLRLLSPERIEFLPGPEPRFRWRNVTHRIRCAEGPERIAPEWWRSAAPARDYFRLEDEDGRRFWLYREQERHWFLHGVFA